MCQTCVDAIKRYWPDLPEAQWGDLLMSATCWPFGDGAQVAAMVKQKAAQSGCDLQRAIGIACDEMDAAMAEAAKESP